MGNHTAVWFLDPNGRSIARARAHARGSSIIAMHAWRVMLLINTSQLCACMCNACVSFAQNKRDYSTEHIQPASSHRQHQRNILLKQWVVCRFIHARIIESSSVYIPNSKHINHRHTSCILPHHTKAGRVRRIQQPQPSNTTTIRSTKKF